MVPILFRKDNLPEDAHGFMAVVAAWGVVFLRYPG